MRLLSQKLIDDERGAISSIAALSLSIMVGVSSLALEFGHGLLERSENQRIADLAAYGGALVYNSTGSSTDAASAATNIAKLNGLTASNVSASVVSSPTGDGNSALDVTVTTTVPLHLARVLTSQSSLSIGAAAYAEMKANAPGCIVALSSSGSGVSVSGGATISASNCAVDSNSTVSTHACSNTITTKAIDYNSSTTPSLTCSFKTSGGGTPTISKATTSDPLSGNSAVSTLDARISSVSAITSPSAPPLLSGTNYTFGSSKVTGLPGTCTDSYASSTHTVTCSGTGPFDFGSVTLSKSTTTTITNTSSGATYNFNGVIDSGTSNTLNFHGGSSAIYNLYGGIYVHGTSSLNFDAGTYNFGAAPSSDCISTTTNYSICLKGGSLTIAGSSTFVLAGGIYQDASGMPPSPSLSLGWGTSANSFDIGKAGDGNSIYESNGAGLFGDATGAGDVFETAGNVTTTGGTCIALPAATQHDVNGSLAAAGGVVLGAGIWTFNGYAALGNGTGGDVSSCPASGSTTGLSALNVTLVVSGTSTVSCKGTTSSFCLGAGFSTVDLTAPTSGTNAYLAVVAPSTDTSPALFTTGATNTRVSGAFYFPDAAVTMTGAATLHDTVDTGACLRLIASQVTLSNGSAAGSTCTGLGESGSGGTVALVR